MKCTQMEEMISLYIDDLLDEHTKNMIDKHLEECEECKSEYEALIKQIRLCNELPMIDLPEEFETDLHEALLKVNEEKQILNDTIKEAIPIKKGKRFNWKIFSSIAAIFIILIVSASTLNHMKIETKEEMNIDQVAEEPMLEMQSDDTSFEMAESRGLLAGNDEYGGNATKDMAMMKSAPKITAASQNQEKEIRKSDERKVIKNAYMHLDIEDYDKKLNEIMNMIKSIGGYVEHSNTEYSYYVPEKPENSLKRGNVTIRVPENQFINIVDQVKELGRVTNFSMNGEDITQRYRDTANEIENLKIQEKRLRQIMDKAKDVKDVLEVERELTRIRGQLNGLTGNIKKWDQLVNLSTIQVSLNEIVSKDKKIHPVDDDLLDKAKKGWINTINHMMDFLEKSFVGLVSMLPILLLIGVIGIPIGIVIVKKIQRK
ncbi:MAG: DUF4349 domain-containing protein [Marinisporobacter sp.]|nr:DUF4349 domain-containing protein [Marinisporobacter sp.]